VSDEPSQPGGFLPPEPGGPEPQLQGGPPPAQPEQSWQPPAQAGGQPQGWQQAPQQWGYQQPQPHVPDNGQAVAGFTLSVVSGTLILISGGLSSLVSVICAGLGIFYSRRGRSRVDRGETPKNRGLAQAGFIVGIVSLVLAILATAVWTAVLVAYITDEDFRRDFEPDNQFNGTEAMIRIGAATARGLWSLIA